MAKEVISGFVEKIENIDSFISFVTLTRIFDEQWVQKRIPVYISVGPEFKGKMVDIISEVYDNGNSYKQVIESADERRAVGMTSNHLLILQIMYEKHMEEK